MYVCYSYNSESTGQNLLKFGGMIGHDPKKLSISFWEWLGQRSTSRSQKGKKWIWSHRGRRSLWRRYVLSEDLLTLLILYFLMEQWRMKWPNYQVIVVTHDLGISKLFILSEWSDLPIDGVAGWFVWVVFAVASEKDISSIFPVMAYMLKCPRGCRNAFALRLFNVYSQEKDAQNLRIGLNR